MSEQKKISNIVKIDGVGVNLKKFFPRTNEEKIELKKSLGFSENDFIITVVAELNKNKNQIMLMKEVLFLKSQIPNLKILLIGKETLPNVRNLVKENNLFDTVKFLGYRKDIDLLTALSDVAFSASLREGLPVNIIEAMACGIPCVCSKNRGHNSLIKDKITGFLFSVKSTKEMTDAILLLYNNPALRKEMGKRNVQEAKKYSLDIAVQKMSLVYSKVMRGGVKKYSCFYESFIPLCKEAA